MRRRLRDGIGEQATPSNAIRNGNPVRAESLNTTHFSVVDRFGNAVSNTYTLNLSYGNGLVADGTGVLLNNEMDDFAAKPNTPNTYGLVGADANAPAPRKRPLSSMTPTIVLEAAARCFSSPARPAAAASSPRCCRSFPT